MTSASQVAARIGALCLTDSGELPPNIYLAMAVRGGLLIDLGLEGRLAQTEAAVEIDTIPLGHQPIDQALAELGSLDGQSLEWWLDHSRIGLTDLADAEVDAGSWRRTRERRWRNPPRYAVGATTRRDHDVDLLAGSSAPETAADVAVVSIAVAAGLSDVRRPTPGEDLLVRAGAARWLCELVAEHLTEARLTGNAVSHATRAASIATRP